MGILNNKSRVLDTIITDRGRSTLAQGGIDISYVSFSDGTVFYYPKKIDPNPDEISQVIDDEANKFQLEASNLPQDEIVFNTDANGRLQFSNFNAIGENEPIIRNGVLYWDEEAPTNPTEYISNVILSSSINNFSNLKLISTINPLFDDGEFGVKEFTGDSSSSGEFEINLGDLNPFTGSFSIPEKKTESGLIDTFRDPKFGNKINYKFLPPVRKITDKSIDKSNYDNIKNYNIGNYASFGLIGGEQNKKDFIKILREHIRYLSLGYFKELNFDPTSNQNNLLIQSFEINNTASSIEKLDFIDYGTYKFDLRNQEELMTYNALNFLGYQLGEEIRIVFAGKLFFKKETKTYSFVRYFTLIFG